MRIEIHAHDVNLPQPLRVYLEARLRRMLGRLAHGVRHVIVHVSDVNGPRGGIDKRCSVRVRLGQRRWLVVQDTDHSLRHLIDRAARRVGRTLAKRLKQVAGLRRPRLLRPVTLLPRSPS